jgi:ABC-type nitrate/sulfonate/bicarbonate transport system permease component
VNRRVAGTIVELAFPLLLLGALVLWSSGSTSFYFPPATDVFRSFGDTWVFERVGSDMLPSLARLAIGYAIAALLGIALGVLLGSYPRVARAVEPLVEFLRAVPPPALIPFAILVLGIGDAMKIFIIALVCLFPILLNTVDGVRGIDPTLVATARVYRLGRRDRLAHVVLRGASPQIFAGLRTSLSLALILMVISELVASSNGIGYFVLQSQRSFDIDAMWSGIVLLGLLGYVLNAAFLLVERRALAWHRGVRSVR